MTLIGNIHFQVFQPCRRPSLWQVGIKKYITSFFVMCCLVLMAMRTLPRIGEDPLEEPNNLMPYVAQVKAWGPESS